MGPDTQLQQLLVSFIVIVAVLCNTFRFCLSIVSCSAYYCLPLRAGLLIRVDYSDGLLWVCFQSVEKTHPKTHRQTTKKWTWKASRTQQPKKNKQSIFFLAGNTTNNFHAQLSVQTAKIHTPLANVIPPRRKQQTHTVQIWVQQTEKVCNRSGINQISLRDCVSCRPHSF